ncbi:RICIN domain-containing protein [Kitasatospora sp. NPDC002543]
MGNTGRPQGQLKGETEQANALAAFVRQVTGATTVRELARRYPGGKTSWSEYRSAERNIPWHLLERLVHDHTVAPHARAVLLARARVLHEQATRATEVPPVRVDGRSAARQALERARQAQREAEAGVAQAEELIRVLVAIVAELRGELRAGGEDEAGPDGWALGVEDAGVGDAARSRRSRLQEATRCLAEVRRIREHACKAQQTAEWEEEGVGLLVEQEREREREGEREGEQAPAGGGRRPGAELVVGSRVQARLPVLRCLEAELVQVREALAERCREVSRMLQPAGAGGRVVRGHLVHVPDNSPAGPFELGPALIGPPRGGADEAGWRRARGRMAAGAAGALLGGALVMAGVLVGPRLGVTPAARPDAVSRAAVTGPGSEAGSDAGLLPASGPGTRPTASPTTSPADPPTDPPAAGPGSPPVMPVPTGTPTPAGQPDTPPDAVAPSPSPGSDGPASAPPPRTVPPRTAEPGTSGRLGGTPVVPPTGAVEIKNGNSLQCMATLGGTREDGQEVQQFPCGDYPDHFWEAQKTYTDSEGDTYYRIVSYNSALCLSVRDSSTEANARVIQSVCNNDPGQSWRIEKWPNGLRFVNGNSHECLAVSYGSSAPHAPLMQYPCGNYPDHYWNYGPRR